MPPKKKKRKPRSRARGGAAAPLASQVDQATPAVNEKRRERLEARREAKVREAAKRRRQQRITRIVRTAAILGAGAAIVWFLFLRTGIPDAIAGHEVEHFDTFKIESLQGQLHTDQPVNYASDPPVSGAHRLTPADCGVYSQQIPKENMVHTLEHGAVGVLYQPDADPKEIAEIEQLVKSYDSHTFSAPYPGLENPYTVVAWAHLMRLDELDTAAIREFIGAFRQGGDAPEANQECPLGIDSPFQATPSPTASPGETPGAEDSPNDGDNSGNKEKKKKN